MSRAARAAGAVSIYSASNILNAAIPFLLLPVLTRVLTPSDYGLVATFGLVTNALGALTGLSVHGAVTVRYFQVDERRMAQFVGACFAILLFSTAAVAAVAAVASPWLEKLTQLSALWLLLAVFTSGSQFGINVRLALWQVNGQALRYGAFRVGQGLLNAGTSLALVMLAGMAWRGRVLGQVASAGAFLLLALALTRRAREIALPPGPGDIATALRFGIPLVPHVLGALLIVSVDRLMINNMIGLSATGIYSVALEIGMSLGLLTDAVNRAFAPWLMRVLAEPDEARDRMVVKATYAYFVALMALAIIIGLAAPALLGTLVGERFRNTGEVVLYIVAGYAFGGMYYMVANYAFFAEKIAPLAIVTLTTGLLNVGATYALIKVNGITGAAQAFLLSQGAIFLGAWWVAQRVRPMPWWRAVFPARRSA